MGYMSMLHIGQPAAMRADRQCEMQRRPCQAYPSAWPHQGMDALGEHPDSCRAGWVAARPAGKLLPPVPAAQDARCPPAAWAHIALLAQQQPCFQVRRPWGPHGSGGCAEAGLGCCCSYRRQRPHCRSWRRCCSVRRPWGVSWRRAERKLRSHPATRQRKQIRDTQHVALPLSAPQPPAKAIANWQKCMAHITHLHRAAWRGQARGSIP